MLILKGRIIDGNGHAPIERGSVIIEKNSITKVIAGDSLPEHPADTRIVEIEDGSILPGLIEAHVHLGFGSASAIKWNEFTPQSVMARALRDMEYLRNQGYTAFRECAGDTIYMKDAVAEGYLDLPRICGSGRFISQIGGHGDSYQKLPLDASLKLYSPGMLVTGVDEMRRACRKLLRDKADFIKIMTTGGVFSQGDGAGPHSHFSMDEIRAAVEEAENAGTYVSTHAQANRGIKNALKGGVKCIEHGFYLDDECIEIMLKNDCTYVPTLAIMHTAKLYFDAGQSGMEYLKEKNRISYEAHYKAVALAHGAGVRIAAGCDFLGDAEFGCSYDKASMELLRLSAAGLSNLEVITCATKNGAHLIKKDDQLGTLEEGKLADVIVVKGNPAADIGVLCNADNVKLVVQDGRVVKDTV